MNDRRSSLDLSKTAIIIPALNEERNLAELLPILRDFRPGQILVCDNGSTDETGQVATAQGAQWVKEPQRGYGAACWAGMQHLRAEIDVVVFLDADLSDDATDLPKLTAPVLSDECDFVLGSRVRELREPGSMTMPQCIGNFLVPLLIGMGWGFRYTDLGPFRAIRRSSLEAIGMRDRAFGWTIEMQIRAVELGLRIREIAVPYRKRIGKSKISGTLRGVVLATYWILRTCLTLWVTKRRRRAMRS